MKFLQIILWLAIFIKIESNSHLHVMTMKKSIDFQHLISKLTIKKAMLNLNIDPKCYYIDEFRLQENRTFECTESFLAINFTVIAPNNSKIDTTGFLGPNSTIQEKQYYSTCRYYKKYY